ncbi:class I SAM-dependent methyltransferase [Sphingomonas sp. ID0503]|uniref:class I SAM-dependent methyltransferase n=1 Tax=Sphingomonas sp. ID0503 TaxID=3399691 RepID=UPI003AFAB823
MSEDAPLPERLARAITLGGPIPVSQFMAAANAHYYATRDPLGAAGDFTTAPEISQMFGELVGAALADVWARAGSPEDAVYVELGPGRGTLAADALRVMAKAGLTPEVHFVETSPVLRKAQAERVPGATWHDTIDSLPDAPLLIVANEFFDALPIVQIVKRGEGWVERRVACQDLLFLPVAGRETVDTIVPEDLRDAPAGSVIETSPASVAVMRGLARKLRAQGGAMLAIDYGYEGPAIGDTLQAVRGHAFANPFDTPGEVDLTAHVDFATLAAAAQAEGCHAFGPADQGVWLEALGLSARTEALSRAQPGRAAEIAAAAARLSRPEQMGTLFKVLGVAAPGWPAPAGFAA